MYLVTKICGSSLQAMYSCLIFIQSMPIVTHVLCWLLVQLYSDYACVWHVIRSLVTESCVVQKYGVCPKDLPDLFALIGDAADNIPGVPGTATLPFK